MLFAANAVDQEINKSCKLLQQCWAATELRLLASRLCWKQTPQTRVQQEDKQSQSAGCDQSMPLPGKDVLTGH
jgi:hypothetical protein